MLHCDLSLIGRNASQFHKSSLVAGKAPRRRATSMDTKAYEKKRGRAKKKVEQLRAQLEGGGSGVGLDGTPTSSLGGSATDLHLDSFQLSPQDFRARTSSNASSIGGRLSPIHAGLEPVDLHDNEVPPMSPLSWQHPQDNVNPGAGGVNSPFQSSDSYMADTLTESIRGMIVGDFGDLSSDITDLSSTLGSLQSQLSPNSGMAGYGDGGINGMLPAPPPYPSPGQQTQSQQEQQVQQRQSPNQRSPQQQNHILMNNSLCGGGTLSAQQAPQAGPPQGIVVSRNNVMMNSSSTLGSAGPGSSLGSRYHQMSGGTIIQNDSGLYQGTDATLAAAAGISWDSLGSNSVSTGQCIFIISGRLEPPILSKMFFFFRWRLKTFEITQKCH